MNSKNYSPLTFGLTGIMGSGKSTVANIFAKKGAIILSEDEIVKQLQQPDQPVFKQMVDFLGSKVLDNEGNLNRLKVAKIIFNNDATLREIEKIVHPEVVNIINLQLKKCESDDIVILDAAILLMAKKITVSYVIDVDCTEKAAVKRLLASRGLTAEECQLRMKKQSSRQALLGQADFVVENLDSIENLTAKVDSAWLWLTSKHGKMAGIAHQGDNMQVKY